MPSLLSSVVRKHDDGVYSERHCYDLICEARYDLARQEARFAPILDRLCPIVMMDVEGDERALS
jgi:hypothetical protein